MYGAATAVIAIPRTVSAVIEIASPHCSMERSVLKVSPLGLYAVRLARRNVPRLVVDNRRARLVAASGGNLSGWVAPIQAISKAIRQDRESA